MNIQCFFSISKHITLIGKPFMFVWNTESGKSPNKSESSPGEKNIRPQKLSANGKKSCCILNLSVWTRVSGRSPKLSWGTMWGIIFFFARIEDKTGINLSESWTYSTETQTPSEVRINQKIVWVENLIFARIKVQIEKCLFVFNICSFDIQKPGEVRFNLIVVREKKISVTRSWMQMEKSRVAS